jgi:acyl carrier protein
MSMSTSDTLTEQFYEIIMDVLGVDREEVTPAARFFHDLGGESIDILELSFRCEKHFGIKIRFEQMLPADKVVLDEKGRFTPETIAAITAEVPFVDTKVLAGNPTKDHVQELITIGALTEYLRRRLAENADAASAGTAQPGVA